MQYLQLKKSKVSLPPSPSLSLFLFQHDKNWSRKIQNKLSTYAHGDFLLLSPCSTQKNTLEKL
jgi:hypothetical protein